MEDKRSPAEKLDAIEGTDAAALGIGPLPEPVPESVELERGGDQVPGPDFGHHPATDEKPWFTSLAAESDQAGVANDPPDAQEPEFPTSEEDPR